MALFNDVPKTTKEQEKRLFEAAQFILETSVRARSKGILELETVSTDALPVSAQSKVIIKRLFDALIECVDLSDLSDSHDDDCGRHCFDSAGGKSPCARLEACLDAW